MDMMLVDQGLVYLVCLGQKRYSLNTSLKLGRVASLWGFYGELSISRRVLDFHWLFCFGKTMMQFGNSIRYYQLRRENCPLVAMITIVQSRWR
jgi:hypothetical protein